MSADLEVRVMPHVVERGRLRVSARVCSSERDGDELWYTLDERHQDSVAGRADPFALSALGLALQEGRALRVCGAPVSASLLRNLEEFQRVWHAWYDHPVVEITAEEESGDGSRPVPAIVTFSGGLDSAFSAYWHARGCSQRDRDLRAAVMHHGVDIPYADVTGFRGAAARSRRMLDSLGLDLVTVETNAWDFLANTGEFFALGIAAGLHLLGARFGTGLIPATASYGELILPLSSNPLSDWMLGSSTFEIVHDGAAYNRIEKLRLIADWEEAIESLRVCLVDPRHDRNCGQCNKCILTILAFRVLGIEPRCFDTIPSDAMVVRWATSFPNRRFYEHEARAIVHEAAARGMREQWVHAMRRRLWLIRSKEGVRRSFPEFADRVATVHRRVHARQQSLGEWFRSRIRQVRRHGPLRA